MWSLKLALPAAILITGNLLKTSANASPVGAWAQSRNRCWLLGIQREPKIKEMLTLAHRDCFFTQSYLPHLWVPLVDCLPLKSGGPSLSRSGSTYPELERLQLSLPQHWYLFLCLCIAIANDTCLHLMLVTQYYSLSACMSVFLACL